MTHIDVHIQEAQYVDPRAGNDKFYRVFAFGSAWITQYGRNGTLGTFTKLIEDASPEAAQKAADSKFAAKVKKGYEPVRSGSVPVNPVLIDGDVSVLDAVAERLPAGSAAGITHAPVEAADLGQVVLADVTAQVVTALSKHSLNPAQPSHMKPVLPVRPMLAAVPTPDELKSAMRDTSWVAQYKYDGDRVVIEVADGQIRVLNRQGEAKTKNVGATQLSPFTALHSGRWVFDGEVVGRTLVLFDLVTATNGVHTWVEDKTRFVSRYTVLTTIATILGIPDASISGAPVVIAPVSTSLEEKLDFLTNAISDKREGIILRDLFGPYEQGRRSTHLIKHKLIKDADVIVTALHATKDSATLSVHGPDGNLVEVGAASTIGKGVVSVGDVWVVTFLYVTDPTHPRLFQPRLVNKRSDKVAAECVLDQFADAGTAKLV